MQKLATTAFRNNEAPDGAQRTGHHSDWSLVDRMSLAKPLRIGVRAVKVVAGLVEFQLARLRGLRGFCKKSAHLGRIHWLKTTGRLESLLQDWY